MPVGAHVCAVCFLCVFVCGCAGHSRVHMFVHVHVCSVSSCVREQLRAVSLGWDDPGVVRSLELSEGL